MPAKLTLNKLAENLILESNNPFSSGDFEKTYPGKVATRNTNLYVKKIKEKTIHSQLSNRNEYR